MKFSNKNLFGLTIVLLIGLIMIQFIWIYRAAIDQEKQFEYTVLKALDQAVHELNSDESICFQVSLSFSEDQTCCQQGDLGREKWNFIDSIIKQELNYSKVCIDYVFQLSTVPHPHPMESMLESENKCFTVKSEMETSNGEKVWLHVDFPGRNKFIFAQIGWLFSLSILLILLLLGVFLLIYRNYLVEKSLARDTRDFINNLAHEFKTPLASIRLSNNRLEKSTQEIPELNRYVKIINQENNRLDQHINYLLDVSRMQKGKMPMNFEVVNLNAQLDSLVDSFKLRVEEREGTLSFNSNDNDVQVYADCFHLFNAFTNLMDNACKYTPGAPKLLINLDSKPQSVVVSFSDNGLGIDKADQKNIFQEFSRVNTGDVHNVKGFGLGLTYVAQVVNLHKGKIWLESKPEHGSTFYMELPIYNSNKN